MSDEEDYMSASFLDVKEDIRPGLVKSNALKRKYEIEKKSKEAKKLHRTKPYRQLEEEQRNFGMDTAIAPDNKGFAMLQKMGYKPGMKLGAQRDSNSSAGLQEPIKVKLKADRGGLGREEEIRRMIKEKEERKGQIKVWKQNETARLTEEFLQRMRDKVSQKHLMSDLNKIRKVCEQLDADEGVEVPMRTWFWFSSQEDDESSYDEEEETVEDEELDPEDQLYFINDYLRSKYMYCTWCGTQYDDENDMQQNCPGMTKEDHE